MEATAKMSYTRQGILWSILGIASLAVCLLMALNPVLGMICVAATNGNHGALIGTMLGFFGFMQQYWADRSIPGWLKILAGASSFFAALVAMVVIALLGWWFLAGVAVVFLVAWFASGRPKLPTWREFNGGR